MKKQYRKPVIIFEDFSLSTNIAAGCESIVGSPAPGSCGIYFSPGAVIFSAGVDGNNCTIAGGEDGMYNGFCYHAPSDASNLFNS